MLPTRCYLRAGSVAVWSGDRQIAAAGRILSRTTMLCALALACTFGGGRTSRVWGDDAAELRAAFRDPPPACRPLIIMHSSPLRSPDSLSWLEARRAGGRSSTAV